MQALLKSAANRDALERVRFHASTHRGKIRVGLYSAAATVACFGLLATMSPIPAAHSATATQSMLSPAEVVAQPVEYVGSAAAPAPMKPVTEDPNHVRATGRIGSDLTRALQEAGVPERIGREYVGVLSRAFALQNGLTVEDKFDLIYERGGDGRLLYVGIDRVGRADLILLKWTDGRETIWVNADPYAAEQQQDGMRMPVAGRVTSRFGSRFHPILGHARMHKGVDLGATMGSPIVAAADGRVVSAGWHGGYGRQVAIAHSGGIRTTYSHMSRISAQSGQSVRQGQVIGYVGSSGLSTGPHLHYEVYKDGRPVNPLSVKMTAQPTVQREKLHALRDRLRSLMTGSTG